MVTINHCREWLVENARPAPRTCAVCGLGPCQRGYPATSFDEDPRMPPPPRPLPQEPIPEPKAESPPPVMLPSNAAFMTAVRTIIRYIGDDPDRPALLDTPERFRRAWIEDWGRGYGENPNDLVKVFKEEDQNFDEIVMVHKIRLYSHCEHHLAPFFGTATIGYLPNPKVGIIGISKLPRILEHFARQLQVQERIGVQVADFLMTRIAAHGVGVILRATHTCMCSRGVNQDAETITSTMRGVFYTDAEARAEFLQLAKG